MPRASAGSIGWIRTPPEFGLSGATYPHIDAAFVAMCAIFSAMAKKTLVQLVDDFSGDSIADGEGRTVRFAFDGAEYEIDLTNENIDEFASTLERYVRSSRRVAGRRKASGAAARSGGNSETAAIREWAESQGLKVATRGRISADIVEQYRNR